MAYFNQTKEKIAAISVLTNIFLAGGKISIGILANSAAVLADGIHSLADIFSSVISYLGIKISGKPSDKKHPYGHYKFEVLAGFLITLILFVTGIWIIYEAYQKFLFPAPVTMPVFAFGIMILSALVNEIMARLKIYYGKKENSVSLLSDGIHSRVDVYASVAILIGLLLTKYWIYADSLLAFLVGVYIIKESLPIGKEAIDSLLDVSAGPEIEGKIKAIAQAENIEIKSLKTQKKGSIITANLEIALANDLTVDQATKISETLRKKLMNEIKNLSYVAIQIMSYQIETNFYQPIFGQGFGWRRQGKFKNKVEKAIGKGPNGYCVCPKCGYEVIHHRGVPCSTLHCPKCQSQLERK